MLGLFFYKNIDSRGRFTIKRRDQIDQKLVQNLTSIQHRFLVDLGSILGGFLGGQDGPKRAQDGLKTPQDAAKTPQDGPKMRPRRHQDGQGGHVKPRSPQVGTETRKP